MVMRPPISTKLLARIAVLARAEPHREVCGLLLGADGVVTDIAPARNVAAHPFHQFEIDPATLLAAHREARQGGPAILGCYHSHPSGPAEPSPRDAADAAPNDWLWLIIGRDGASLWRATSGGERHGRFDPVPLACIVPPESPQSAFP